MDHRCFAWTCSFQHFIHASETLQLCPHQVPQIGAANHAASRSCIADGLQDHVIDDQTLCLGTSLPVACGLKYGTGHHSRGVRLLGFGRQLIPPPPLTVCRRPPAIPPPPVSMGQAVILLLRGGVQGRNSFSGAIFHGIIPISMVVYPFWPRLWTGADGWVLVFTSP